LVAAGSWGGKGARAAGKHWIAKPGVGCVGPFELGAVARQVSANFLVMER
jgi:hypothetical protein